MAIAAPFFRTICALGAALAVSSCAPDAVQVVTGPGPRVVSLNPCTDAILAEVAEPGQIAAISHYSQAPRSSSMDLATAIGLRATGGTAEEVVALQPDIVLASSFIAPATRTALERMGIRVETFGIAISVVESEAQVRRVAALVGQDKRGEALNRRIQMALSRQAASGAPVAAVMWQPGGIVPGSATLIDELMVRTGFTSDTARRGLGQASYLSLEQVLAQPPDVLMVAGNDIGQHHRSLRHLGKTRVETFDPALLYCGGPTIIRAAKRLGDIRRKAVGA